MSELPSAPDDSPRKKDTHSFIHSFKAMTKWVEVSTRLYLQELSHLKIVNICESLECVRCLVEFKNSTRLTWEMKFYWNSIRNLQSTDYTPTLKLLYTSQQFSRSTIGPLRVISALFTVPDKIPINLQLIPPEKPS